MFLKPNPTFVSFRANSKDGHRNAIAMLQRTTFEEAEEQVQSEDTFIIPVSFSCANGCKTTK